MYRVDPKDWNEAARQRAVDALRLGDSGDDPALDELAALASDMLGVPIALVTLIDRDRQIIKARIGCDLSETERGTAFCDHTIANRGLMVVEDASLDARFNDNPMVTGEPHIRFYAGMPVNARDPDTGDMQPVGAICAIGSVPRKLVPSDKRALKRLAIIAEGLIAARAARTRAEAQSVELRRQDRIFGQAERMAAIGSWRYDIAEQRVDWSDGVFRIHDLPVGEYVPLHRALEFFPPHDRPTVSGTLEAAIKTGAPFDFEVDFITATGRKRRVRSIGELELSDGSPCAIVGVFQDVTERHDIEVSLRRSASVDELTRIANRAAFNTRLETAMNAARSGGSPLALALIDLDWFKAINDTHGHLVGDDVLRAAARRLDHVHRDAFAARIGGDEFALILPGLDDVTLDGTIARLVERLQRPVQTAAGTLPASGTIGYAVFAPDIASPRDLIHRADSALYRAKRGERGTAERFGTLRDGDRRSV